MIIKKPYAFLIKNFKIIHLFLSALLIYIVYKSTKIFSFFNSYAKQGFYSYYENINKTFLGIWLFLTILGILIFSLIIYAVMKWKNKKRLFYLLALTFYVVLLIFILYTNGVFTKMISSTLNIKSIRAIRDIWLMFTVPQYAFISISIIRGLGFNIKSFDFQKDIEELKVNDKDSEEIEVKVSDETYKYFRSVRKYLREFKYYLLENKKILLIILSILLSITGLTIGIKIYNNSKIYMNTNSFSYNQIKYNINDIYLTTLDYKGKEINNKKKYLIVSLNAKNQSDGRKNLDRDNFIVRIKNKTYQSMNNNDLFKDLGTLYTIQSLNAGEEKNYLLAFEIDKNEIISNANIMFYFQSNENDESIIKYYVFNNKIKNVDTSNQNTILKTNEKINISNNVFIIKDYNISNSFTEKNDIIINKQTYSNISVIKPNINYASTYDILKLSMNFISDKSAIKMLFSDYGFLYYMLDEDEKNYKLTFASDIINDNFYIYVPKEAKEISIVLNIRSNKYIIELKNM